MNGPELPRLPRPQPPAKPATRITSPPQSPSAAIVSFFAASRIPVIQPLGKQVGLISSSPSRQRR